MKCTIPEISWHNREPVLSVDIFPENKNFYRLASGGGDCHVLIWQMNITRNGAVTQEVISDLTRHQRAVNCVRWSSTGQYLASGDDDANIIIWHLKTDDIPLLEGDTGDREIWIVYKVMRGHKEDVYDICWSLNEGKILSGSVDNTAILWDVNKGKMDHILSDHKGFVQGVCWDPKHQIIATISTDRICRIFDSSGKQVKARIHKGKLLVPDTHFLYDKEVKFFHDDTFKSFFRRLQFTPDGSLLIVPSGHMETDNCKNVLNATLLFTRDNFSSPAIILPLPHQSSTVVTCCPILFELQEDGPDPVVKLPYRMIFAVGTDHDIILYDTQQTVPFARFQDIHYTRLTDLTWSHDGLLLIASSTDGFCSLITFEMFELGIPWTKVESEEEENSLNISGCEEILIKDENVDINNKNVNLDEISKPKEDTKGESKKRPSFLKQWALQKPKKKKLDLEEKRSVNPIEIIDLLDSPEKKQSSEVRGRMKMDVEGNIENIKDIFVNKLTPRRITPLKVEESTNTVPRRTQIEHTEPGTSKPKAEARSTQKQIDLSKENSPEDEEDSSDSEEEKLNKEELEELHKASENIREFFCRVPKKQERHGDVTPIAVRRQPRGNDSTINTVNSDKTVFIANNHSDAKLIEIRRKPRDPVISQTYQSDEKKATSEAKNHTTEIRKPKDQSLSEKKAISSVGDHSNPHSDVYKKKLNEVKGEKYSSKNATKMDTECNEKEKKVEVEKSVVCQAYGNQNKSILTDLANEECNIAPKKLKLDEAKSSAKSFGNLPPKIKESSLVKSKITNKTPKRTNALLNFLQKSTEKRTKPKADKEVDYIDLSLEENEARDAWKCDSKQSSGDNNKDGDKTVAVNDDNTEDFCLQLEDSKDECDDKKTESRSLEKVQVQINKSDEINNTGISRHIEEKCSSSSINMPKTPRRVPLTTLASPKGKTRKE